MSTKGRRGCYFIKYINFHNIDKSLFSDMEETVLGGFLFSKWLSFLSPSYLKPFSSNLGKAWGASREGVLSGKVRCVGTWELMKPLQNFCVGRNCVCFPTSDLLLIFLSPDIFGWGVQSGSQEGKCESRQPSCGLSSHLHFKEGLFGDLLATWSIAP